MKQMRGNDQLSLPEVMILSGSLLAIVATLCVGFLF